jgi:7SK snRNA methylphosphate capping enzyme
MGSARVPFNPSAGYPLGIAFVAHDAVSLALEPGRYDAISCFSVVKWIHLNHGDAAVQRLFSDVHAALRPGGVFVLEPQPWSSYRKRRALNPVIAATFAEIQLHPGEFARYLVDVVGFETVRQVRCGEIDVAQIGWRSRCGP